MKALIIVDVQNDFCPGGALGVKEGDVIVAGINQLISKFNIVVTTQDWHPANHGSFAANHPGKKPYEMGILGGNNQVMWPVHCVQNTNGAAFHSDLQLDGTHNFVKGTNPNADSYSGFFDDDGKSTGLDEFLKQSGIADVYVCGLATDYCVKFTALDAVKQGYRTTVIEDLCRGVNISQTDSRDAIDRMKQYGILAVHSSAFQS